MVELSDTSTERAGAFSKLETAMRFPVGSFSPLWMMYAGAASAGVAYWWMSRWTKPSNLEAMFAAVTPAAGVPVALEPLLETAVEVVETVETAVVEAAPPEEAEAEVETEALEAAAFAPPTPPNPVIEDEAAAEAPSVEAAAPAPASEPVVDAPAEAVAPAPAKAAAPAAKKKAPAKAKPAPKA